MSRSDEQFRDRYEDITTACKHHDNPKAFYLGLIEAGMALGVTLQNLVRISSSHEKASCNIRVSNTAATMPENLEYPHAIHPALLESVTHMMIPALTGPKLALKETLAPKFIDSVYISNDITSKAGDELQGYATAKLHNSSLAEGDIVALDPEKSEPLVVITKMQYKALPTWDIGANEWQPTIETSAKYRKLCSQMTWKLDQNSFRPNETVDLSLYFDCLFHKNPSFKILQVGGDPADVTSALLLVATADGSHSPLFSSLVYTAASAKAIADAGVVLAKWSVHVQFEKFNIEGDLTDQNFEPGTYDLVIIEGWDVLMIEHGFASGPALCRNIAEPEVDRTQLVVVATAGNHSDALQICGEALIIQPINVDQEFSALMTNVVARLSGLGFNAAIVDMYTAVEHTSESCLVINMVEIKEPLLLELESKEFEAMKSLVLRSKSLLWVTMGGVMTGERPAMNMASGFARTMRYETDSPNFATLDLGSVCQLNKIASYGDYAYAVGSVALSLCEPAAGPSFEREFAYHDGHLDVPRVSPLEDMNNWMNGCDEQLRPEIVRLDQIGCSTQIAWKTKGHVGDLYLKEDSAISDPIRDNHVQIDVKVSALNTADLTSLTENMGLEWTGGMTELRKNVRHLRKGHKVMAIGPGCHRTDVRVSEDLCQRIPDSLSFEQGASIPMAYCTAYSALVRTACLRSGESILIYEGSDGIDQAAAGLALHLGAEVFMSSKSLERRTFMIEQLHIARDHVLTAEDLDFSRNLLRLTKNKGVNVVIGSYARESARQSWHCIPRFGPFVILTTGAERKNTAELDMRPFERSATFSSVDVIALLQHDPDDVIGIFREVRSLLDQGNILPVSPINVYNYCKIREGFETLCSGSMRGKTVLSAQDEDLVPLC